MTTRRKPLFPPVFAPTVSHPMVDDFTLRAARLKTKQPAAIPLQYSLPLRAHPLWSGNNELGRETPFAADANNRQTVLKMEEWGPPQMWTVALGLQYDAQNTPDPAFTIASEIQFGVGGAVQRVEIDWKQGAAISVPANSIVVNALYPLNDTPGAVVPSDLVLRATLAQMETSGCLPTRSYNKLHLATTPISVVPIPPFAKNVTIGLQASSGAVTPFAFTTNAFARFQFGTDDSPATIPVIIHSLTQTVGWLDFTNQLLGPPVPLLVPEGARSLAILWAPGGVTANPPNQFQWNAQFGIGL